MIEPVANVVKTVPAAKAPEPRRPITAAEQKKLNIPLYVRRSEDSVPVTIEKVDMKKVETMGPVPSSNPTLVRSSVVAPVNMGKANENNADFPTTNGHRGIAVPMTMEEIEREMSANHKQVVSNSTPKEGLGEGLSTWILLSGNNKPTVQPDHSPVEADKKMDKIARIKENQQTVNQINKKKLEERIKNRQKLSTTTTTTTTTVTPDGVPEYAYDDEYENEDEETEEASTPKTTTVSSTTTKQTTKKPNNSQKKKQQNESQVASTVKATTKKPKRPVTTTTTTAPTIIELNPPYETTLKQQEPSTMIVLEPKDAGFDLPQDRSPTNANKKKRPTPVNNKNNKNKTQKPKQKKKPASSTGTKNNTKVAKPPKKKQNPMSTQIYNYIAREVMPTVGVGLMGLVVTAGLATYLLGSPLTALRRSYEIADRKDDLYQFNNEEYAGPDGQNEEEMFGKVIAGMPSSSLYRSNIRYPAATGQPNPTYRPNPNQIYQGPPQGYSSSYGKYGPYNRYRYTVPPTAGYRPVPPTTNNFPQYQPQPQPQSQYRYNTQGQAQSVISPSVSDSANVKTVYAQSMPSSYPTSEEETPIYTQHTSAEDSSPIMEQTKSSGYSVGSSIDNTLQRRTQFVVGSVVPDASETTEEPPKEQDEEIVESTSATGVPEHGPRRRRSATIPRRRSTIDKVKKFKTLDDNELENENEVDGIVHMRVTKAPGTTESPKDSETTTEFSYYETSTLYPGQGSPLVDFFRRVLELKVKYGITFLKSATNAFQRYLSGVEERVQASPILNPQY